MTRAAVLGAALQGEGDAQNKLSLAVQELVLACKVPLPRVQMPCDASDLALRERMNQLLYV